MKIGVISDTHIPDRCSGLPPKVVEAFRHVDMIIHAGDLVELSVVESLQKLCPDVKVVCGNMDGSEVRDRFPSKLVITAGKFRIGVMHGWGPPQRLEEIIQEAFREDKVQLIIFGHSHVGMHKKKAGITLFNPGSATDTVFAPYNSYGLIEINDTIEASIVKI